MFSGLLDDPTFHGAVEELGKEETPHFQQLPKDEEEEESLVLQRAEEEVIKVNEDQLVSLYLLQKVLRAVVSRCPLIPLLI